MKLRRDGPLRAFTLIELLIALAILAFLVILLASLVSAVGRSWTAGEQQVSEFQDGRAILEIISRELSQAVISPNLQFVQNPTLPSGLKQRANSDSLFWQAPAASTTNGNLAEIGYYLTEDKNNNGAEVYQLRRFFVPPTDSTNYKIFSSPYLPTDNSAPWVTSFVSSNLSTPVASGVIAFWARCFDCNGDLIPWLFSNVGGVGSLKFNSAAHFQPASPGQNSSFKFTNASTTALANLLPSAVEVTIVTLDPQAFKKNPSIPPQSVQSVPDDLPDVRESFNQQLISSNTKNAHAFSTRVNLANSAQR
jgi:prepilin-type N-terminal cleavage/methylation domain-containing protein